MSDEEFGNRVVEICSVISNRFQEPKSELLYTNNYTLLIAVILSARNTDKQVNNVTKRLFAIADNPAQMLALGYDKLCSIIRSIGLYKTKAKYIIESSRILLDKYNGKVPGNKSELLKLPGVGSKTANVVLNLAFKAPVIAVDTHVFRVSQRLGLSDSLTPEQVERDLDRVIPPEYKNKIGMQLLLYGRYVCRAKSPDCSNCDLKKLCNFAYN